MSQDGPQEHHVNVRPRGEKKWYSPEGDLAHSVKHVIGLMEGDLFRKRWPWVSEFCLTHGITEADLITGIRAYAQFLTNTTKYPTLSGADALKTCGWDAVPQMVRLVILATLGKNIMELQWKNIRRASYPSMGPTPIDENIDVGARINAIADNILHGGTAAP